MGGQRWRCLLASSACWSASETRKERCSTIVRIIPIIEAAHVQRCEAEEKSTTGIEAAAGSTAESKAKQRRAKKRKEKKVRFLQPANQQASQPTSQPTNQPTNRPTDQPANQPTI